MLAVPERSLWRSLYSMFVASGSLERLLKRMSAYYVVAKASSLDRRPATRYGGVNLVTETG